MKLGITGGSGIYGLDGLEIDEQREIFTPYGKPSAPLVLGRISGQPIVFIARHGLGHTIPPHKINYRANIWALKSLGVTHVVAISAVGSLKPELPPGDFVMVDQFVDLTRRRDLSFFDDVVVHVSIADPVCHEFAELVAVAGERAGGNIHRGGTYVNIEGPQFSTRAESNWYRSMGASVIGMTNATEARLAREAELHFSTLAMVTDYDCWHESEEDVTVESVMETMRHNGKIANQAVLELSRAFYGEFNASCSSCDHVLTGAVMTDPSTLSRTVREFHQMLLGAALDRRS
ncbi:S-methyl-5'-thioadenosine phosphorylase [Myxococcota bacterium]|nr:S-methyl-5'-thioadenosine phosphorylase [Myxococcota bacterium]